MIEVKELVKAYNKEVVLDIPDLKIDKGQLFGLVGNNGAGKTTLFNLVLDLIKASRGYVVNNGIQVDKSEDWKAFTSAYIDESFTIGYLTPDEYFNFIGEIRGLNEADLKISLSKFDDFFHGEIRGKKKYIRDLSKGNQKKVGIVAAMLGKVDVIVLDEPFSNLDPSSQFKLREIIRNYAVENNVTFLISGHTLDNITDVCTRIVILEKGKIVKDVEKTNTTLSEIENFFMGIKIEDPFILD